MKDKLGTRDELIYAIRSILATLPKIGLVKRPSFHKDGISVILPVKDEEQWIKLSILSIEPIADEIIIIDSSIEDNTTEIIESLAMRSNKIKHIRFYWQGPNAFALSCHIGLACANYKWIFKWDSDFVAKSKEALIDWRNRLTQLDQDIYYTIDMPRINLEGDIFHQPKNCPFGIFETRLFTWSPELKWVLKDNYWEQVCGDNIWGQRFPPWYKIIRWRDPYIFHCNIKSAGRMLMRMFWMDFMINRENRFPSLEAYTLYRVQKDWNMSLEAAEQSVMEKLQRNLIPYDKSKYGDLPEILTKNIHQNV